VTNFSSSLAPSALGRAVLYKSLTCVREISTDYSPGVLIIFRCMHPRTWASIVLPIFLFLTSQISFAPVVEAKRSRHVPRVSEFTGEVSRIHDGDTFTAIVGGIPLKIRLNGIDAPELSQPFGLEAKYGLGDLIHERIVRIVALGKDKNRRTIADVYLHDGRRVNDELVKAGMAWWSRKHSRDKKLEALEAEARRSHRGLWAQNHAIPPWRYRYPDKTLQSASR